LAQKKDKLAVKFISFSGKLIWLAYKSMLKSSKSNFDLVLIYKEFKIIFVEYELSIGK
jgi:hypothetical protein